MEGWRSDGGGGEREQGVSSADVCVAMEVEQERCGLINRSSPIDWLAGEVDAGGGSGGGWGDDDGDAIGGTKSEQVFCRDCRQSMNGIRRCRQKLTLMTEAGPLGPLTLEGQTTSSRLLTLWGFEPGPLFRSQRGDVVLPDSFERFSALGSLPEDNDAISATGETGEDGQCTIKRGADQSEGVGR
ncbi:hypothetical protein R1sor_004627 [Riccia sorocarpa]|uniref:Uncharacterized protein n=1 Tax=Riccia sorocarpa TaxID=122646 RepID=A0ABD3HJ75_9MARC